MGNNKQGDQALEAENARLRARVEELERMLEGGAAPREAEAPGPESIPYQALFDALPMPLSLYRANGAIVGLNDAGCAYFQTTRERILGKYNIFQDPQATEGGHVAGFRRALAGEVVRLPPIAYETAGDFQAERRRIWTEATYVPIADGAGVGFVLVVILDITAQKEAEARQRSSATLLEAIIQNAPLLIYARDAEGRHTVMNRPVEELFGVGPGALLGKTSHDFLPEEIADRFQAQDVEAMASAEPLALEDHVPYRGDTRVFMTTKFALRDEEGKVTGVCGISMDITERVRAEERSRELQEEMLRVQQETIRAISTPLLPIADGVLVAPLVGEVTRERAAQFIEVLLEGIASQQARITILDVTGVPHAGAEVTDALIRAARSVRLLGAEIVLSGIRPSVAQALVELGADLGGIATRGTLERAVAYALAARGGARSLSPGAGRGGSAAR